MKRGRIVLVPFPFTDLSNQRVRPALIVSSDKSSTTDVVVAFISSVINERRLQPGDFVLRHNSPHFAVTGLHIDSVFRMGKLATLDRAVVIGELGRVPPVLQAILDDKLRHALAL